MQVRRAVYQCDVCPKVFRYSYWKKLHMKVIHELKDAGTTCKECKKTFSSRSNLKAHISLKHLNIKGHKCDVCTMSFLSKKDLINHVRQHHSEESDKLKCQECEKTFGHKSSYERHVKTCRRKGNHPCPDCSKSFGSKDSLYNHKRAKHSSLLHICEKCGKGFDRMFSATRHVKTVHKDD